MLTTQLDKPFPKHVGPPRSEGLHLTDITNAIYETLYAQERKRQSLSDDKDWRLIMEAGFIWERLLEMAWRDLLGYRPEEVVKDGIAMSPDGLREDPEGLTLLEHKFTSKSSRNFDPMDNMRYALQTKSYAYAVGAERCEMHILHMCGDYSRPYIPEYSVWLIEYTQQELEDNWQAVLSHAKENGMLKE